MRCATRPTPYRSSGASGAGCSPGAGTGCRPSWHPASTTQPCCPASTLSRRTAPARLRLPYTGSSRPERPRHGHNWGMTSDPIPADLHFYFDPVCPFAWMTSKWVRMVAAQREYRVDWRFISLRIVNADVDYAAHFPEDYEDGHTAGLRLLRVAARARAELGRDAVAPLYEAFGTRIFDTSRDADPLSAKGRAERGTVEPLLRAAALPADLADALDDQ